MTEITLEFCRTKPHLIEGLNDLCRYVTGRLPNRGRLQALEIGCYLGESTEVFASYFDSITTVDPHRPYEEVDEEEPLSEKGRDYWEAVYESFLERMSHHSHHTHYALTSKHANELLSLGDFNLIYIDGNHDYESCLNDITRWSKYVRGGDFIAGHDYEGFDGVTKAVDEVFVKPDAIFKDSSWIVRL